MSYDIMVFDKAKAPTKRLEFMQWYIQQTQWEDDEDYQSIERATEPLRNWFMEMKDIFPPMNGPFAKDTLPADNDLETRLTDYSIGESIIYAAFSWSQADNAFQIAKKLAQKHDVGFFNLSGKGEIILPDGTRIEH